MAPLSDWTSWLHFALTGSTAANKPNGESPASTNQSRQCRYRLDNDSARTFTLSDGRKLGYAEYGSPTGRPVLYQHGHPGSRCQAAYFHDLGLELGARVIAIDRPGMGWSSPHPGRKLLDLPKDLEQLASHLKLEDYRVLGVSGGGPHALACAYGLPHDKLKAVTIVCGLGPSDIGMKGADLVHRIGFGGGYRWATPMLSRWFWSSQPVGRLDLSPEQRFQLMLKSGFGETPNAKDAEIMKDQDTLRMSVRCAQESFAQGFEGVTQDGKLMCADAGFRVQDIRPDLPFRLWYGKQDNFVPLNHGRQIAARLGDRAYLREKDETHASIFFNWRREILEDLLKTG